MLTEILTILRTTYMKGRDGRDRLPRARADSHGQTFDFIDVEEL